MSRNLSESACCTTELEQIRTDREATGGLVPAPDRRTTMKNLTIIAAALFLVSASAALAETAGVAPSAGAVVTGAKDGAKAAAGSQVQGAKDAAAAKATGAASSATGAAAAAAAPATEKAAAAQQKADQAKSAADSAKQTGDALKALGGTGK